MGIYTRISHGFIKLVGSMWESTHIFPTERLNNYFIKKEDCVKSVSNGAKICHILLAVANQCEMCHKFPTDV